MKKRTLRQRYRERRKAYHITAPSPILYLLTQLLSRLASLAAGTSPPLVPFTPAVQKARSKSGIKTLEDFEAAPAVPQPAAEPVSGGEMVASAALGSPKPKGKHVGGAPHSDTSFTRGRREWTQHLKTALRQRRRGGELQKEP